MRIIPAIDVLNGKVVRLTQGDFGRVQTFSDDPLKVARQFKRDGAFLLHLVNLSGAENGESQESFLALIKGICEGIRGIKVQVGGGMRTLQDIQRTLDAGAASVIIGTMLVQQPETVRAAVLLFGKEKIIGAIDTAGDDVRMMAWKKASGKSLRSMCTRAMEVGIRTILVTDIERDGMEQGPNVALYRKLAKEFPSLTVQASGGIRNLQDCEALNDAGCTSAIVGKALVSGRESYQSLCVLDKPKGMNKDIVRNSNSLAIRIIPCLDIANGRVVKGMSFTNLRDSGDPVELAKRYCEEGADELVFLDITATNENRRTVIDLASRVANAVNIPFTIGGGIRSVEDAKALLAAGADKVAINSAAVRNPQLLKEIAQAIGSANTICAIDGKRQSLCHSERRRTATKRRAQTWTVLVRGGRDDTGIDVVEWSRQVVELGAGELLVTSFDNDGQGQGFDTELLAAIKANVSVPVIASGGARSLQTFVDAVKIGKADAVLAATVFHFGKLTIKEVKTALSQSSFPIRP